jgi:hypothetical protein
MQGIQIIINNRVTMDWAPMLTAPTEQSGRLTPVRQRYPHPILQKGNVTDMLKPCPFSAVPVPAQSYAVGTQAMTSPRRTSRLIARALATFAAGVTLAACGHAEQSKPAGSSSAQPQPASPGTASATSAAANNISRVDNIKGDFPSGFTVEAHPAKTLSQHDIDSSGITAFTKAKADPPQCRSLIIPPYTEPSVGTRAAGVQGQGDQGKIYVVALGLPKPVPARAPAAGCSRVSLSGSPQATGTAESVPAPQINGVTTTGVKLSPSDGEDPDYIFTAALNDQTSVVVMGSTDSALNPQQLLSDLLVKATSAVRGQ